MTFSAGGIVPRGKGVKAYLQPGERVYRPDQAFCWEDGCREPATTSRPNGMAGDTPVVELVCEKHKHCR